MSFMSRSALILATVWSITAATAIIGPVAAQTATQDPAYRNAAVAKDGQRYETQLKAGVKLGKKAPRDLRIEANRVLGTDPRAAVQGLAEAVIAEPKDADGWIGLARALLAIKSEAYTGNERYDLPVNASGAAYLAYERATTPAQKATALDVLHEALKRRSYWRPAIDALKASLAAQDVPALRKALDELVAEHGFRILEYKVDIEAAQPRLCIQFSERLAPGQSRTGRNTSRSTARTRRPSRPRPSRSASTASRTASATRCRCAPACPPPSARSLRKTAELGVYVRDRAPSVRVDRPRLCAAEPRPAGHPARHRQHRRRRCRGLSASATAAWRRRCRAATSSGRSLPTTCEGLKERTGSPIYKGELAVASASTRT